MSFLALPAMFVYGFLTCGFLSITFFNIYTFPRIIESPSKDFHEMMRQDAAVALPQTPPVDRFKNQDMSACLIVMDDNHYLIEWLAYHYHTVNLRHLIVTSDPTSRTSPLEILDRWRDRINIHVWNETDFLPADFDELVKAKSYNRTDKAILEDHRVRQATFNLRCLNEFKRQDRGWTMIIDSDEYMIAREDPLPKDAPKNHTPTIRSVSDVLFGVNIPVGYDEIYNPCIPINRRQFQTTDSKKEDVQAMVPPGFDGLDFSTMRWRHHSYKSIWYDIPFGLKRCGASRDIPNKVVIDLRLLSVKQVASKGNQGNPHKPLKVCEGVYAHMNELPLLLNHYMGTPEQWYYRSNDKRGLGFRQAKYEDMNQRYGLYKTDAIRPWLADFVKEVGSTEAKKLLKDVGKLEPLPNQFKPNIDDGVETVNQFKVGDVVEANWAGQGVWKLASIYGAYSNDFYSVLFADCVQEIATSADRLRPTSKTVPKTKEESGTLSIEEEEEEIVDEEEEEEEVEEPTDDDEEPESTDSQ